MARKRRRTKTNTWLWYGLYAAVGYYAYNWYQTRQQRATIVIPIAAP
jgi:uncharacterized membrane protein YebE (DUF533 family)